MADAVIAAVVMVVFSVMATVTSASTVVITAFALMTTFGRPATT